MISFLPWATKSTRACFAGAGMLAVLQLISQLATFSTAVSNADRLAALAIDDASRGVKLNWL